MRRMRSDLEARLERAMKPPRLPVPLDEATKRRLSEAAKADERSLAGEALVLIREALDHRVDRTADLRLRDAISVLLSLGDRLDEHTYQELASALEAPPRG